jgi:hypothetical protein
MRSGANAARCLSDALAQVENARHRFGRCVLAALGKALGFAAPEIVKLE